MIVKEFLNTWVAVGGVSITSSVMTYFFTRKKYNNEADNQELANVQKALEIYRGIIDDLRKEQAEMRKESGELRKEMGELRKQMALNRVEFEERLKIAKQDCND